MLVITRKKDEAIVIGDAIQIRVLRVGAEGVRLGVSAPHDVPVHREEVYDLVVDANQSAAISEAAAVTRLAERLRLHVAAPATAPRP
ncbi:MAG: carbon storage regulator CsrA [Acidobacteria bacterium]|nr:carbon storage regulator CsrA [Acidobacteriota bacterium]